MPRFRYPKSFVRHEIERDVFKRLSEPLPDIAPKYVRERVRSQSVKEFLDDAERVKVALTERPKVVLKTTALLDVQRRLSSFREADFSNPTIRSAYRALRAHEEGLKKSYSAKPAGADNRRFNPAGKVAVRTTGSHAGLVHKLQYGSAWSPMFLNPASVIPCIQRAVRREVMFATGKAGKGYRKPHRRTEQSGIPC